MTAPSAGIALDARALDALQRRAAADPKAAAREVARQFESLFMKEVLKSMREASLGPTFDGEGSGRMASEMLDDAWAGKLAGQPGGLADLIARQLERQVGMTPGPIPATGSANDTTAPLAAVEPPTRIPQTGAAGFVQQHRDAAAAAEAGSGIPAAFMVAQAAHETGWGRREIRHADGSPSYNLFGIKAGQHWPGARVAVPTLEFRDGVMRREQAAFRAYDSLAEGFADYVDVLRSSPRYRPALAAAADPQRYAAALQQAGYATDPGYGAKIRSILQGDTLQSVLGQLKL
jgi:flagellar protein FlgJ